jgi:hypothetical protein
MGVLQGTIVMTQPSPVTLPKLYMVAYVNALKEAPIEKLTMKVTLGGKQLLKADVPTEHLNQAREMAKAASPTDSPGYIINIVAPLTDIAVESSGDLTAEFETEAETIHGTRLRVTARTKAAKEDIPAT